MMVMIKRHFTATKKHLTRLKHLFIWTMFIISLFGPRYLSNVIAPGDQWNCNHNGSLKKNSTHITLPMFLWKCHTRLTCYIGVEISLSYKRNKGRKRGIFFPMILTYVTRHFSVIEITKLRYYITLQCTQTFRGCINSMNPGYFS